MAEWQRRSKKNDDVIYFPYGDQEALKSVTEAYLWDVDKTYLDTKFETFRGILRTATEKASQKKNIPGASQLAGGLKSTWTKRYGGAAKASDFPIFFITASPPQMERKICEKLRLDGIQPRGIFCKDNLQNLWPRRFWRLNKQVGYKLQALLQMRSLLADDVRLVMFGDDGEADSIIYSLFSDICAHRLDSSELRQVLNAYFVMDSQVDTIFRLRDELPNKDPVEKIYINLAEDTDADYYKKFGRRTLPTYNSFQVALDLYQDDRLEQGDVIKIAKDLVEINSYTVEQIGMALDDLVRRQVLARSTCESIIPQLIHAKLLHDDFKPSIDPRPIQEKVNGAVIGLEGAFEPWIPERIDYLHDYR